MLNRLSALAIVPKAKAIAARRLTPADYDELMRKGSVPGDRGRAARAHPYFKDSLAGLSGANIHREQLEQALARDIFYKYESLLHYVSSKGGGFASFFMMRCEIEELLEKLRLLAMGFRHHYIARLPGFLADKTSFSLIRLAKAETPAECLDVVAGTPYARVLEPVIPKDGAKLDHLLCEHALWSYYFETALAQVRAGRNAAQTRRLFLMEAEIYDLDLIWRAKAFFSADFTPRGGCARCWCAARRCSARRRCARWPTRPTQRRFLQLYNASRAAQVYGARSGDPAADDNTAPQRAWCRTGRAAFALFQRAADGAGGAFVPCHHRPQQHHQRGRGRALFAAAGRDSRVFKTVRKDDTAWAW